MRHLEEHGFPAARMRKRRGTDEFVVRRFDSNKFFQIRIICQLTTFELSIKLRNSKTTEQIKLKKEMKYSKVEGKSQSQLW